MRARSLRAKLAALPAPIHLQPTAPLAERVLLPGDPGRALLLAQELLEKPAMFNHNRGLWGYTGAAADGEPLTIQSTGIGGPSAAIVVSELAELGARRLVRVGTCEALDPELTLGELVLATEALAADGTSRALGAADSVRAAPGLTAALRAAGGGRMRSGRIVSTDLLYDGRPGHEQRWRERGALAVEMETATLFALAAQRGLEAASLLIVSNLPPPRRVRIEPAHLHAAELRLGATAFGGLRH